MTNKVSSLTYIPTADNSGYVANVNVDSAVDTLWDVFLQSAVDGGPANVVPNWLTVDNYSNSVAVTYGYGTFLFQVGAYQRQTFKIPLGVRDIQVSIPAGKLTLYIQETTGLAPDNANFLAIQEAALNGAKFPFVTYTAPNSPQNMSDNGERVKLVPVGVSLNYLLLNIAVNGIVNGWLQFITNSGDEPCNITPGGGDTLNSLFTNASPFVLMPGETMILACDGAQWYGDILTEKPATVALAVASYTQKPSDEGRRLTFGNAGAQAYDLQTASMFGNGYHVHVKNTGTGILSLVPAGADQINGYWTNGTPLKLSPGDKGDIFINDQGLWKFEGSLTWESPEVTFNNGLTGTFNHNLGVKPHSFNAMLRCKTAQLGYVPGDEFVIGNSQSSSGDVAPMHAFLYDATKMVYTFTSRTAMRTVSITDGTDDPFTVANFMAFFRLAAQI